VATILASIALGLATILNVVATAMLLRSDFESRFQKTAQCVLIWLLPVVGVILVMAILINSKTVWRSPLSSDASGTSSFPGSDGDLNRPSGNQSDPWGGGGGHGHGGGGGFGGH
jgi:hypothetical protein